MATELTNIAPCSSVPQDSFLDMALHSGYTVFKAARYFRNERRKKKPQLLDFLRSPRLLASGGKRV